MIRVLVIFGTRPESIKMAPLVKELKSRKNINCTVCITAQHREMLDQVLNIFEITPDFDLNIMKQSQSLTDITVNALVGLQEIIRKVQPHIVLVHGDTTTTFTGALAAFYEKVSVGHVEAGLRTYNKYSPFPEESNRQMVDCLSDIFFAPTKESMENLINENKNKDAIVVTGNTAIDALKTTVSKNYSHPLLDWCKDSRLILLTAHRRENLGTPMYNIFNAINRITRNVKDVKVIYPMHLNPKVREVANKVFEGNKRVKLIEPLDVLDFHNFMEASYIILTDSGGIQEEAPSLSKPVLVLRDTTERPEGIAAGTLKLVGTNEEDVYNATLELLFNKTLYTKMSTAKNPYGDGFASKYITDVIIKKFS